MAVPQSKDELLKAIDDSFSKLIVALDTVPEALAGEPSLEGHVKGTRMSVGDLVAYLIGWNELVLTWFERDAAGRPIDYPDTGFKGNELGRLAQKFYRDYQVLDYKQRLERLRTAKAKIVSFIDSRENADLYGRPWYDRWTMGRMIQFNTASPYENARRRLRIWQKSQML